MKKTVWLGYDPVRNLYRTPERANAKKEWTAEPENAQIFGNEGHARNSARYYSRNQELRELAQSLAIEVEAEEIEPHFERKSRVANGVTLGLLPSGCSGLPE